MEVVAETASFGNVLRLQELKVMKMKMNLQRSLKQLDSILKICEDQDLDRDERRAIVTIENVCKIRNENNNFHSGGFTGIFFFV